LVVGASYVALECAGFLTAFGYDTTVMVRSIFLRGFDQQCANKIAEHMENNHTKFIRSAVPEKLEKMDNGKIKVTYKQGDDHKSDEYDTVLFAIGPTPLLLASTWPTQVSFARRTASSRSTSVSKPTCPTSTRSVTSKRADSS
jgi:pyruvate/2-oxoglutarate dehydrogenase complex dihydrolipoamide dehydrogenase (E3) component